jgi:hypothetical protein
MNTYDAHIRAYAEYCLAIRWDMLNIVFATGR